MDRTADTASSASPSPQAPEPGSPEEHRATGIAPGVNISPGSDDDGWIVPPPVALSDGSTLQLFKDGEALHAAYEAIRHAQRRVCLEVYIFHDDATGNAFADLLCKKASAGVPCFVLYDSFGSLYTDRQLFRRMRRAGVSLRQFHPLRPWECTTSWRPFNRDHRKLLFIDSDIAGIGGLNIGAEYAGSWAAPNKAPKCEFWRDNGLGIRGPSARIFFHSFQQIWRYAHSGGRIRKAQLLHNLDGAAPIGGEIGLLASAPTVKSKIVPMLTNLFRAATESIQLTMAYFAPSDELIDEICRAARRGVRVQLMLPGRCDVKLLLLCARSFYEKLLVAGVEIYERQSVILHAKTLVIDGAISLLGSTNLDYRSIEYNCEISAIIRSREFGRQIEALFANDIRFASRIDLNAWRHRPWADRVVQWAVSRARYLL